MIKEYLLNLKKLLVKDNCLNSNQVLDNIRRCERFFNTGYPIEYKDFIKAYNYYEKISLDSSYSKEASILRQLLLCSNLDTLGCSKSISDIRNLINEGNKKELLKG